MRKLCILFTVLISKSCSLISLPILKFDYYHIKEFEYYNEKYVYDCYTTLELEYLIVGYIIKEADVNYQLIIKKYIIIKYLFIQLLLKDMIIILHCHIMMKLIKHFIKKTK